MYSGAGTFSGSADQQDSPSDDFWLGGCSWQSVVTFTASAGGALVTLGGGAPGSVVVADGVLVIPARTTSTSAFDADGDLLSQTDAMGNVTAYTYLCPCQLAGADFLRPVCRRGSQGTGRFNFAHSSMAA